LDSGRASDAGDSPFYKKPEQEKNADQVHVGQGDYAEEKNGAECQTETKKDVEKEEKEFEVEGDDDEKKGNDIDSQENEEIEKSSDEDEELGFLNLDDDELADYGLSEVEKIREREMAFEETRRKFMEEMDRKDEEDDMKRKTPSPIIAKQKDSQRVGPDVKFKVFPFQKKFILNHSISRNNDDMTTGMGPLANVTLRFADGQETKVLSSQSLDSEFAKSKKEEANLVRAQQESMKSAEEEEENDIQEAIRRSLVVNASVKKGDDEALGDDNDYEKEKEKDTLVASDSRFRYVLKAVVSHQGTPVQGHYYAHVHLGDGQWMYYNDATSSPCSADTVLSEAATSGAAFLYVHPESQ